MTMQTDEWRWILTSDGVIAKDPWVTGKLDGAWELGMVSGRRFLEDGFSYEAFRGINNDTASSSRC